MKSEKIVEFTLEDLEVIGEQLVTRIFQRVFKAKSIGLDIVNLSTGQVTRLRGKKMAFTLRVDQKVTAVLVPVDQFGNVAQVDGIPVWGLSDGAPATLTPATDGLSAVLEPQGPVGTLQLNITGDADMGAGVKPFVGVAEVTLVPGEAVAFNVTFGTPEPR